MLGTSRGSHAAVAEAVAGLVDDASFASVGGDLLAVADLLGTEPRLRTTLADSGTAVEARHGLVARLFGDRLAASSVGVVELAVEQRWSAPRDLADAVAAAAAQAMFIVAEREGRLDDVQDQLFKFGRAVVGSAELQMALTDPSLDGERKAAIVRDLLADKAQPETVALLVSAVVSPRGRRLQEAVEELVELASVRRLRLAAEVTSAVTLTADQETRLAGALGRLYGREVDIRVIVDPTVLGGISVRVGDEVLDGTTLNRLDQARRRLVG